MVFLETHNDSEEGVGWFLLKAICYNNGEDYPECLPFKIDDSMEVVLEAFGEKSEAYEADEETSYRWEKRGGDLFIEVSPEGGLVQTVTICKEGW